MPEGRKQMDKVGGLEQGPRVSRMRRRRLPSGKIAVATRKVSAGIDACSTGVRNMAASLRGTREEHWARDTAHAGKYSTLRVPAHVKSDILHLSDFHLGKLSLNGRALEKALI